MRKAAKMRRVMMTLTTPNTTEQITGTRCSLLCCAAGRKAEKEEIKEWHYEAIPGKGSPYPRNPA